MIIGIPKEIKTHEYRVGITSAGVKRLAQRHKIIIQKDAGIGSGITNAEYEAAGAEIVDSKEEIWSRADMIIKVKEPLKQEYPLMKPRQIIFTYFHLVQEKELANMLLEKEIKAVAYETIQLPDGSLPCLKPMSEVAGKMSVQIGAEYLKRINGGKGVLLGGVPGTRRGRVVILGAGVVGKNALKIAHGMGANVTVLDIDLSPLSEIEDLYKGEIETLFSDPHTIKEVVTQADLIIGAVLTPGARAKKLVPKELISKMEPGSVIVDVSIDQGGCFATSKEGRTWDDPIYKVDEIIHFCVANMPGVVPYTSTIALSNTTIKYAEKIADLGLEEAISKDEALAKGVNSYGGFITCIPVAEDLNLPYKDIKELI
jgi:alanine dehydrogenase